MELDGQKQFLISFLFSSRLQFLSAQLNAILPRATIPMTVLSLSGTALSFLPLAQLFAIPAAKKHLSNPYIDQNSLATRVSKTLVQLEPLLKI